jgi:sugar-specific transcriptional regulator TrmB
MSQEKVLKTLANFGFTDLDAKVYVLLSKRGPIKARDVAKALKISKQRVYPLLKKMQSKGIVNSTLERPARFTAIEFEKLLDSFLKAKMEQARHIQENKEEILADWQSITITESDSSPAKFTVIEGRSHVYSKIQQMIQDTRENLSFVTTVHNLARADQYGLFDAAINHPMKSKIRFRFLSELSNQNTNAMKVLLKKIPKARINIEGKTPDLGLKLCPRMVIKDKAETLFFIDPQEGEYVDKQDDVCLWTNCKSLVHGFLAMFEDLWYHAKDINKKIVEIEADNSTLKKHNISDVDTAYKKYLEALHSAKEEIVIITSAKGLIDYWKGILRVKQYVERGVVIKIMAPIEGKNIEAAQQLLKFCEIRNISTSYQETTIIDGKYLFQFNKLSSDQEKHEKRETNTNFKDTFHTNDHEYVEKTKNILNNIWRTSYVILEHPPKVAVMHAHAKMIKSAGDQISNKESTNELKRIFGLTHVRLTLDRKIKLDVNEIVSTSNRVLIQKIIMDVELEIEDKPTLIGKAIIEREMVILPQKHGKNLILRDYYEISFPQGGGFEGNALVILENITRRTFWEKSKAYALFSGTGTFEGQTLNIGHPWQNFHYPIVWTGYLLNPKQ